MQNLINGICRGIMVFFNYTFIATMIDFRYSKKKCYLILGAIGLFSSGLSMTAFMSGYASKNHSSFTPALIFLFALLIGSICVISKGSIAKKFFAATMVMDSYFFSVTLGYSLSGAIFGEGFSIVAETAVRAVIYVVLFIVSYRFLRPIFIRDEFFNNTPWIIFDIIALLYLFCFFYCNDRFGITGSSYASEPILVNIIGLMMIFTFAGMFYTFSIIGKHNREKEEMLRVKNKDQLLDMELRAQDQIVYNARKIKHDVKHHANVLSSYLNNGNYVEAQKYLNQYIGQITDSETQEYSKNHIVNAIFRLYDDKCCKCGIDCSLFTDVPEKMKIDDTRLCGLLSNMLENAVEACKKCENPSISFHLSYNNGRLSGYLDNTTAESLSVKDGLPVSTKENGGTGTKIISEIIREYGGVFSFEQKDNLFLTRFTINI